MKILIVTGIFPPDIGGPATYVPLIAGALASRGHQVKVLTTSEPEDLGYDDRQYPFPVVRVNRRLPLWRRTFTLIRLIIRHGREADVIYANGMHLETALANKLLRKPLVMKIVGDEAWERATRKGWTEDNFEAFQSKRQPWPAELNKWLRSWATRQADRVIVPSRYLKQIIARWGVPEDRCKVVYNAAEPLGSVEPAMIPLATPAKLITVGRLVPWKHVDSIIEALVELNGTGLVVVGDGPEKQRLEALTQSLGLTKRVYFTGQRSKEETHALMAACNIFVLNSSYEGLPHVIVEAMQVGLPVIATAVGGTPEVVQDGETGLLIPPDDVQALQKALARLINNPDLRRMLIEKGRLLVQTKFNKEGMIDQTEAVLLKVAKNFSRSSIHAAPENHRNSPIDR
ncbi:glycosyltransferase involved in cell wall biosynthesis [Thermodesulfitimonas autotrophica]|uniref:Glycosyltransferase involved in cell wall biosynthesis n=2 Tax=Thermodesulfitimonas autotrophica TaxID=1894989 RepID=A0A3N5AQ60_9THEO|nr:glycosyltransferase involved in cell wall biosynthesis [Thermodesulfitimonas autotrophica]